MHSMCSKLPPPEICALSFESYVSSIHSIISICHAPSLRESYLDFWLNLSGYTSPELLVLILSALYTGGANNKSQLQLGHVLALLELYDELMRAFDINAYYFTQSPRSIQLLQGYVIMNTFRASQLAPFGAFSFLPFAIRSAQTLQLHRKSKVGNQIEIEVGHRLW